jgi:hypothetical protein
MKVLLDVIQATTLASLTVLAGGQTFIARNVVHALGNTAADFSVRLHQELLTWRNGRVMRPAGMTAITVMSVGLIVIPFVPHIREAATIVLSASAYVAVWGYKILAGREHPINHEVESWGTGPVPPAYAEIRATWDVQQRYRLALTWLSFACSLAAVFVNT